MTAKQGRGALWLVWGNFDRNLLERSVASFKKFHPDLGTHIIELPPESTLLDKAKMFDLSPFEETLYLDADTVVLGDLCFGFSRAALFGMAVCICECPWARRFQKAGFGANDVEYNSGVIFWNQQAEAFFNGWKILAQQLDSQIEFIRDGNRAIMPLNDQASFSTAINCKSIPPFILPLNWNLRPDWHKSWFGPVKIWHHVRDVPKSVLDFNEKQTQSDAIIDYFPGITCDSPSIEVSQEVVKLNLGETEIEGYRKVSSGTQVPDGSVDEIIADHVLQRFGHRKTMDVLTQWVSALKPGGLLKISVPDFDKLIRVSMSNQHPRELEHWMLGSQENEDQFHRALFTEMALKHGMLIAGLAGITRWKSEGTHKSASDVALNLQGRKPKPVKIEGVHAFLSVPRYGSTATSDSITVTLIQLGIPLRSGSGCFWHESLSNVIEDVIDAPNCKFRYALTLDYDTMLVPSNVTRLYQLMEEHPEADAICGVQMRRGHEAPLLVIGDENGQYVPNPSPDIFKTELTPALSAHFGCTLFRVSSLKKFNRPWFESIPTENGSWRGKNYVSCDVNFWWKWKKQGFTLFQANAVPLAHLEEVLFHADPDMKRVIQELNDYRANGIPISVAR